MSNLAFASRSISPPRLLKLSFLFPTFQPVVDLNLFHTLCIYTYESLNAQLFPPYRNGIDPRPPGIQHSARSEKTLEHGAGHAQVDSRQPREPD